MEPKAYPHAFYIARWQGYFALLMGAGFLLVVIVGLINHRADEGGAVFMLAIAGVFFWLGWRTVSAKGPALQFGPDGIWTPRLGDTAWNQVVLEFRSTTTGKSGTLESLYIIDKITNESRDSVSLTSLSGASSTVKELLQGYKKARIR